MTIHFEKTTKRFYESFELDADSLDDAYELAEQLVDDGEADTACISDGDTDHTYDASGWSIDGPGRSPLD